MQNIVIGQGVNNTIVISGGGSGAPVAPPVGSGDGDMKKSENLSGLSNYASARSNLGLTIGANVQAYDADLDAIAALTTTAYGRSFLTVANSTDMRSNLGLTIGVNVQAYDADLDAISLLSTTSYGRSFLTFANSTDVKTNLGLTIGTNVQAYDTDLDAIAALTTTSFGRSFLTLSSGSDARTQLALGTAAVANTGIASGNIPVLDSSGKLVNSVLPAIAITDTFSVSSQAQMLALTAQRGDIAIRSDTSMSYVLSTDSPSTLADWKQLLVPANNITGNAETATRLQNPRTFAITGDTTATAVSFDGTANVSLATTLNNSGVTAATYGSASQIPVLTVDAKGRITTASTVAASSGSVIQDEGSAVINNPTFINFAGAGVTATASGSGALVTIPGGGGSGGSLPTGGSAGQYLAKNSATDGDASWVTPLAGYPVLAVAKVNNDQGLNTSFSTLIMNSVLIDTHNGWSAANNWWTVPAGQAGLYQIFGKYRPSDSTAGGVNYGIGMGKSNVDDADFFWTTTVAASGTSRHGVTNFRVIQLAVGDQIRIYGYAGSAITVGGGSLSIFRIR